jgi:hypothetical protein
MVDCICEFLEKPYLPVMKHEYVVSLIYHNFFLELLSVYDNPQKMSSNSQNPPKQTALTKDSTEYDYSFVRLMVTISVYYKDIWQDVQKIMHVPSSRFVARIFIPFCKQIGRRALMRGPHVVHYRNGERTIARIILNIISYNSRAINAVMLEIPIRHSTIPSSVPVNTDSSSRRSSPATTDHNTRRRESSAHSTSSSHISVPLELTDADQQLFLLTIVHFLCIFYGSKHLIAKERPGIWHELATFISHTFSDESINQETICIFVELIVQSKLLLIMQPLIPFIHDQIWRLKYKIATIQRLAADVHNFSGIKVKDNSRAASSALIVGQQPPIDYNAPGGRSSQSVATALGSPALRLPKKSGSLANVISKAPSELVNSVSTFDSALWAEKILAALDDKISPAWTEDRILDFITSHLGSKK